MATTADLQELAANDGADLDTNDEGCDCIVMDDDNGRACGMAYGKHCPTHG